MGGERREGSEEESTYTERVEGNDGASDGVGEDMGGYCAYGYRNWYNWSMVGRPCEMVRHILRTTVDFSLSNMTC